MRKHLTVTLTENFDPKGTFYFEPQNPNKHGFDKIIEDFTESFRDKGLRVKKDSDYVISMEYYYIYKVAYYKMQYANLVAQIMDRKTNQQVGKIFYDGNFNVDELADEIAVQLSKKRSYE